MLLRPVHHVVKNASQTMNESPWSALVAAPGQAPPLATAAAIAAGAALHAQTPYGNQNYQQARTGLYTPTSVAGTPTHTKPHPGLSLSTKGPLPPPNPLDPLSATSTHSSITGLMSSGYQTPLPPTPMSAALGPAAVATMPMTHPGASLTVSVPTPAQMANMPPQNGLFTPTMAVSPNPLGINGASLVNPNNLASPNFVTSLSTPTVIPGSILSPPPIIAAPQPQPVSLQNGVLQDHGMQQMTNGYPGYFPKTGGAGPGARIRTQAQPGHVVYTPPPPPPNYGGQNGIMQRTRSVSQRRI